MQMNESWTVYNGAEITP